MSELPTHDDGGARQRRHAPSVSNIALYCPPTLTSALPAVSACCENSVSPPGLKIGAVQKYGWVEKHPFPAANTFALRYPPPQLGMGPG